jgi:hypothetical protein
MRCPSVEHSHDDDNQYALNESPNVSKRTGGTPPTAQILVGEKNGRDRAAAYVEAEVDGDPVWGVGTRASIVAASLDAVVNAVNRSRLAYAEREAVLHAFERRPDGSR